VSTGAHQWLLLCGYAVALVAMGYSAVSAFATRKKPSAARRAAQPAPPVTILKPLCGAEPETYECLRSFCEQDYPHYQVIFGLSDPDDAAVSIVRRLQREFPALDLILSVERRRHGNNPKVNNLINMQSAARHEHLVIADSDVRVGRDYLANLIPPLLDADVGIVTCCYRGVPLQGIWSLLGSMYINAWFIPSVRVAALSGYRSFAFGATIAIRRDTLARIGGFSAISNQLADDYWLGELTRRQGLRTVLSTVEVDTFVRERSCAGLIAHELRWRRTIRNLSPCGYAFSFVTLGLPVTALQLLFTQGAAAAAVIFGATALSSALLHLNGRRPNDSAFLVFLLPVRDLLHLVLWIWSFATRRVQWRGDRFVLRRDGAAQPIGGLGQ
jgi:ceramide glucosyltransferase